MNVIFLFVRNFVDVLKFLHQIVSAMPFLPHLNPISEFVRVTIGTEHLVTNGIHRNPCAPPTASMVPKVYFLGMHLSQAKSCPFLHLTLGTAVHTSIGRRTVLRISHSVSWG